MTVALPDLPQDGAKAPRIVHSKDGTAPDSLQKGLPAPLPFGEHIIWQGAPRGHSLSRQVFHTGLVAAYFAILAVWRAASTLQDGGGTTDAVIAAALAVGTGALVIGILELLGWLNARATTYTITNRRVFMRVGIALTNTIDIPFKTIDSIQLKAGSNGVGNISIKLKSGSIIPYFILWPHARPWHLKHPQPMLRAVPNVHEVARILVSQLEAATRADAGTTVPADEHPVQTASEAEPAEAPSPVEAAENRLRVPLLAAGALILMTIVAVGLVQLSKPDLDRTAGQTPQTIYELSFKDIGSDRLAVIDTGRGDTIAIVEPGRDGLVRGALRGLNRARERRGLPVDAPYQLVIWDNGRMTLSDLETKRHIPLDSFGPANTGALAALLRLKDRPTTPADADQPATPAGQPATPAGQPAASEVQPATPEN